MLIQISSSKKNSQPEILEPTFARHPTSFYLYSFYPQPLPSIPPLPSLLLSAHALSPLHFIRFPRCGVVHSAPSASLRHRFITFRPPFNLLPFRQLRVSSFRFLARPPRTPFLTYLPASSPSHNSVIPFYSCCLPPPASNNYSLTYPRQHPSLRTTFLHSPFHLCAYPHRTFRHSVCSFLAALHSVIYHPPFRTGLSLLCVPLSHPVFRSLTFPLKTFYSRKIFSPPSRSLTSPLT